MRITNVAEEAKTAGVKMLVYGESGAGKTHLISTLPMDQTIIISAESGLLALARALTDAGVDPTTITVLGIDKLTDLMEAYTYVATGEGAKYRYIALDSISEIAEQIFTHERKTNTNNYDIYPALREKITGVIKSFRDLRNRHVYFSAKTEVVETSVKGIYKQVPDMSDKKMSRSVPYLFSLVLFLEMTVDPTTKKETRVLKSRTEFNVVAKDRSGMLAPEEPANLSYIVEKVGAFFGENYVPAEK